MPPWATTVADIIRNAILDGSLKPGEPLHENALARELSVSRSPIREALIQLERERLVVGRANRPALVRKPTLEEITQVYTIRSALEGITARWAAEKAKSADVALMKRKAEHLNRATLKAEGGTDPGVIGLAVDFHATIAAAAGSVELQQLLQSLCNQITLVMTAGLVSLSARRADEIHAEHLAIIEAIADQDGDRAERLASAHVCGARDRLVRLSSAASSADAE